MSDDEEIVRMTCDVIDDMPNAPDLKIVWFVAKMMSGVKEATTEVERDCASAIIEAGRVVMAERARWN